MLIDRLFGEPRTRWHPVAWMGALLAWPQAWLERQPPRRGWLCGTLAWAVAALLITLLAWVLEAVVWRLLRPGSGLAGWAAAALVLGVLLKPLLAWRMLADEVRAVDAALASGLDDGRRQLSRLVSRNTATLDPDLVRESAIETLAENLNDSVIAPLLCFVIAGLPGAALYRLANTADAMWGYRDQREWMGKTAARADDLLSWLPARLTALALLPRPRAWRRLRRQAARTPSPNSGWPMAAIALRLGLRLRKPFVYQLNDAGRPPHAGDIAAAIAASRRALALVVPLLMALAALLRWRVAT
ncbi:cobalamin biosynthesis protein CobD [Aquincola sp. S2]|uniref:Cobalamin biosynthesis protein CobD n=2 Tax=Pseudaquabacterium terrae TaxID=2732868 RepID=A0ABX2EPJ6_9BURK|nr:adenosylcobinamide-phosphate synthase CbiB [Aquabacterium terrae]NRF70465.1 cobalamin biosynthesis protein CobD [Aquabacterium terrae]